jgi:RHS repeat-associated protein
MRARLVVICFLSLNYCLSFPQVSLAQQPTDAQQTLPPFGSFSGNDFDVVSLQNGNLHVSIPLISLRQRGGNNASFRYIFDTPVYYKHYFLSGTRVETSIKADTNSFIGWRETSPWAWVGLGPTQVTVKCAAGNGTGFTNYAISDPDGATHIFALFKDLSVCGNSVTSGPALDDSGIIADVSGSSTVVHFKNGDTLTASIEDTNGNIYSPSSDTVNRAILTEVDGPTVTFTTPLGHTTSTSVQYRLLQYKDSNGATQTFRIDYEGIDVHTGLCGTQVPPACTDLNQTRVVPSKLTLPTGATYQFTWVNNSLSQLQQTSLPTGASISYVYGSSPSCQSTNIPSPGPPSDLICREAVASRTLTVSGTANTWNYSYASLTSTVTDPASNDEVHTWSTLTAPGGGTSVNTVETQVQYFQGTGSSRTLLKQITKTYATDANPIDGTPINIRITQVDTALGNGLTSRAQTDYESFQANSCSPAPNGGTGIGCSNYTAFRGNATEVREYDYGPGGPGPLLRKTDYTYLHNANTTYAAYNVNIVDRVASKTVFDGSGTQLAQTSYEYDNYSHANQPMLASGAVQHDSSYNTSFTVRGNLTATKIWRNTDNTFPTTTDQYDDAGNLLSSIDPLGHQTSYSYADAWGNASCAPSGGNAAIYRTATTDALGHTSHATYNSCAGSTASATDANNLQTTFSYDLLGRLTLTNLPDGGQTSISYNDVPPVSSSTTTKINSSQNRTSTSVFDGVARLTQAQLTSDPQGTVYTDTTYDSLGRVATVSNPYRSGSDPTTSSGTTTYTYDALGRKTAVTYPDGSVQQTAYCGNSTLVTDPAGKWRRSRTDGLGRLTEVDEPNALGATVASTGCPGTGEPIWITTYGYDALGNLTSVLQNGSRSRSFTYNSLSQLLTSTNPENGTITYTYDNYGNVATKKDARNITATYAYDALNRNKTITYSNGDPSISINYDEANCLGLTACQNIGQRTSMTDAAGSEAWSYQIDAANLRSIHVNQRTNTSTPSNLTKTSTYYLDLAGNLTSIVYPTGRTVSYTYDAASRPITAADSANGITYTTSPATPLTGCLANAVCYTPQGSVYSMGIGKTSAFTGLNFQETFNNRLQPNELKATSTGGNAMDISYNFVDPVSGKNAGHVYSTTNNLDSTRSQTFTYDQLNRIASAKTTSTQATSAAHCWGEVYTIDSWANLQTIAATTDPAYTGCLQESGFAKTPDGSNHLSGFGYDLSGNTTGDGSFTYTWDGESQLKTAGGVTYTYDGDGRRVSKSNGKFYWYGSGGEILAETSASGATTNEYIFFGGKRVALLPAGSSAQFYAEDLLGTSRVVTTNTGGVCYDADFYPFGGERTPYTNTCTQNAYKFEGKERDAESGNDEFGARYYSNRFGRWLSADWSNVPAPVPYANLTNPQTLNLYAMVHDDPETFADLDGHCIEDACIIEIIVGGAIVIGVVNHLIKAHKEHESAADHNAKADAAFNQLLKDPMSPGAGSISQDAAIATYTSETKATIASEDGAGSELNAALSETASAASKAIPGEAPSASTPSAVNAEKAIGAGIKVGNKAVKQSIKATQEGAGEKSQQDAKQEGSTFWGQIKALFGPKQPPPDRPTPPPAPHSFPMPTAQGARPN